MTVQLHIKEIPHGGAEYDAAVALRHNELRAPLGLHFKPSQLAAEMGCVHVAGYVDEGLICYLLLERIRGNDWKMRQVVVHPKWRGYGVGRSLIQAAEQIARRRGATSMLLHARETVIPFYEKLGYEAEGDYFEEVTLLHRKMLKALE